MDNNLRHILTQQKAILSQLENEVSLIEDSDLTKENTRLKAEIEKLNAEYENSKSKAKKLATQNTSLQNALYEQAYNEKANIVHITKEKLDIYFKDTFEAEQNRLTALETTIGKRITAMTKALRDNNVALNNEIYRRLGELASQVNTQITETREKYAEAHGAFSENERAELESLKNEQITDEQILAVAKKNNMERFFGLNLFNKLGILLILIGVITAARYTYFQLPDTFKGLLMFALGAAMLLGGELLNRKGALPRFSEKGLVEMSGINRFLAGKNPSIFSLGITAGGVAVLYAALAISYFELQIITMYPALGLCVLITAVTFVLSTRYNSQTILAFSLVGGYLPLFSIISDHNLTILYGAMVYFVLLNLLALMVSFKKKWTIATYIGMTLNTIGTAILCGIMSSADISTVPFNKIITIVYILFAFLVYSLIPIVGTYKEKLRFRDSDVVLLGINTLFSSIAMYLMFYAFGWENATGLLAIIFAVAYLLLGKLIETKFIDEEQTKAIFYLTGLTFTVLVVPFQFGRAWLSLGWLVQGVALTTYGILKGASPRSSASRGTNGFVTFGYIINVLCLCAFVLYDVLGRVDSLFPWKYTAITLGSLIILGAYMYKKTMASEWQTAYKYMAIINLWFYVLYMCSKLARELPSTEAYNTSYLVAALAISLTFLIAYTAPRIAILSDTGTKIISIILYVVGIIWLFGLNSMSSPYFFAAPRSGVLLGSAVLILISLLSVLALRDLIKLIVMEYNLGVEWYPLIVSSYFVIILTQNLISQYELSFTSAWISIIYALTALAWIVFGFARRYSFMRVAGLGLAILAVIKLFLVDLVSLTQGYRIVSYFVLGITLVTISFVYQYFSKRLELKLEPSEDIE
ncbi:MAG: DUF2339 domain-containing protein [Defluviitaleaceae bacterium]|nr:DUF2339 domain-containing protein [Defluviitaleaceae bacterium]